MSPGGKRGVLIGGIAVMVVVVVAAVVLVVPSLMLVYRLDQQSRLEANPLEVRE